MNGAKIDFAFWMPNLMGETFNHLDRAHLILCLRNKVFKSQIAFGQIIFNLLPKVCFHHF